MLHTAGLVTPTAGPVVVNVLMPVTEISVLSQYAVVDYDPAFVADFEGYYFRTGSMPNKLSQALTHSRSGNATMTDGYGPELVAPIDFTSGWTSTGASVNFNSATEYTASGVANIYKNVFTVGKVYAITINATFSSSGLILYNSSTALNAIEILTSGVSSSVLFTAVDTELNIRPTTAGTVSVDNISVREMPVIKWAPHNLLTYSEEFDNPAWSYGSPTSSVVANTTEAPDGTVTADEITFTGLPGNDYRFKSITGSSAQLSFSVWLKTESGTTAKALRGWSSGSSTVVTVTEEWQLFTLVSATGENTAFGIENRSTFGGSGTANVIYAWGAHVYRSDLGGMVDNPERGDSYVPTTASASYLPRVGHHVYNGDAWVNEGLLHESESRTNLITYSNDFNSVGWTRFAATVTENATAGPDGILSASSVLLGGSGKIDSAGGQTVSSGATATFSLYVKENSGSGFARLIVLNGSDGFGGWFNTSTGEWATTASLASGVLESSSVESVGDGWYRISLTGNIPSATTYECWYYITDADNNTLRSTTVSQYIYGAQLEEASTPSSYIPTAGATVTRAAETLTVPAANLPWPYPEVIGDELVTNGAFDTDTDWTKGTDWSISGGQATHVAGTGSNISQAVSYGLAGTVYALSVDVVSISGGSGSIQARSGGTTTSKTIGGLASGTTVTLIYVHDGLNTDVAINAGSSTNITVDNISVREINPLSVSIQMDGRMTYADNDLDATATGATGEAVMVSWKLNNSEWIAQRLDTASGSGQISFGQRTPTALDTKGSIGSYYSPGVLVPYNIASRHGSTFLNGAVDGTALTANTTPTALPDLSSTDLDLGYDYMGTINQFRVWSQDLGDTGIATASITSPAIYGVPTISGNTNQGATLTATSAPVVIGTPTPTTTWQWKRSGAVIAGATSSTYTLVEADVGSTITVTQTETNDGGSASATSAATDTIVAVPSGAIQQRDGSYILDRSGNYIETRA